MNDTQPREQRPFRPNRNKTLHAPKKPAGHQSALTKNKGNCIITIDLISRDDQVVGKLIDSDRYTITVQQVTEVVIFKHDISSYWFSPLANGGELNG